MHWYFCKYSVNLPDSGVSEVSYKIKSLSGMTQFLEGYLPFTLSRRRGQGTILIPYSQDSTQALYAKIKLCEVCMGLIVTRLILAFCLYFAKLLLFCFMAIYSKHKSRGNSVFESSHSGPKILTIFSSLLSCYSIHKHFSHIYKEPN